MRPQCIERLGPVIPPTEPMPDWIPVTERLPARGIGFVRVARSVGFGRLVADFAVYEDENWLRFRCDENGAPWELVRCDVRFWLDKPPVPELP